ncbi:hypothetical protein BCV70DRAFT_196781 [Testicularia cyperi]|uniref:chitin synthase n=1 Tax=Testicularia cyperi TaxID=1882483 RepID=A0A317XWQ6_9BASI|nr:hypothetical protein BCV70DRAFT_196781 [Testicularia cyperi]
MAPLPTSQTPLAVRRKPPPPEPTSPPSPPPRDPLPTSNTSSTRPPILNTPTTKTITTTTTNNTTTIATTTTTASTNTSTLPVTTSPLAPTSTSLISASPTDRSVSASATATANIRPRFTLPSPPSSSSAAAGKSMASYGYTSPHGARADDGESASYPYYPDPDLIGAPQFSNPYDNAGPFSDSAAATRSPIRTLPGAGHLSIDIDSRQHQGHVPQLSESFYNQAASALSSPLHAHTQAHTHAQAQAQTQIPSRLDSIVSPPPPQQQPQNLEAIPEYASYDIPPPAASSLGHHSYYQPPASGVGAYSNLGHANQNGIVYGDDNDDDDDEDDDADTKYSPNSMYDEKHGGAAARQGRGGDYLDSTSPFGRAAGINYLSSPYAAVSTRGHDDDGDDDPYTALTGAAAFGGDRKLAGSGEGSLYDNDGYLDDHDDDDAHEHADLAGVHHRANYNHGDANGNGSGSPFGAENNFDTQHFGPAPARGAQLRRHKTKKNVRLTKGNLILDCPVPTKLQTFLTRRGEDEFTTMRYSAVTCDPDDFGAESFTLRPAIYGRHTELFIAITMYNEDEVLFCRTFHGVMKNIAHLCSRNKSRTWGTNGWKKVVVAIISDGRKKIHPRVLDCLAALGVYQDGVAKNMVDGKEVQAHLYEYTTQLSIDANLQFKGAERGLVPMQIIFCLKEKNAKKINSHRWFFNAFCPILQPNVTILLDVGTRPENKSIYYLWKSFDLNSNVAGACGEICADTRGKWGVGPLLLNPLVAAQNFEYKISNILDKTTESVMGYISVLPGAFSAYRYIALQNDELGHGPLASYFKGENLLGADADVFTSNMYLAEDRILCFELAAKRGSGWVLKYVKSARGVTDVPEGLPEFISQRRRWLNGSFFAAVYSLYHTGQFLRSGHNVWRKALLVFESFYSFVNMCFAWFGLANYYIFFRILTQSLEAPEFKLKGIGVFNVFAQYIYLGTVVSSFIFAMGNRPQGSKYKYWAAVVIFALLTVYMMVAAILCIAKVVGEAHHDAIYAQMVVSLLATYGVYLLSSLLACDPLHLVTSFVQYLLLAPTYINILNIYAFCNLHDFSWGTKGDTTVSKDLGAVVSSGKGTVEITLPTAQADIDTAYDDALNNLRTRPLIIRGDASNEEKQARQMDYYKNIRTNVVLAWALSNGVLAAFILNGNTTDTFTAPGISRSKVYMVLVLVFVAGMACIRFIGSSLYLTIRLING